MYHLLLLLLLNTTITLLQVASQPGFLITPKDSSYFENVMFPCYCQANELALVYDWKIDHEYVTRITPGVILHREFNLAIMEISCNSNRNIECCFEVRNGSSYCSDPATLRIQDHLGAVRNLQANSTASSIEISWDPPLNISSIEPPFPLSVVSLRSIPEDSIITYTVEVFNVTGMRTPVISVENITASKFTFLEDNHDPSDKFEFIVTAFNIVVGRGDPSEPVNATFLQDLVPTTMDVTSFDATTFDDKTLDTLEVTGCKKENSLQKQDAQSAELMGLSRCDVLTVTDAGIVSGITTIIAIAIAIAIAIIIIIIAVLYRSHKRKRENKTLLNVNLSPKSLESAAFFKPNFQSTGHNNDLYKGDGIAPRSRVEADGNETSADADGWETSADCQHETSADSGETSAACNQASDSNTTVIEVKPKDEPSISTDGQKETLKIPVQEVSFVNNDEPQRNTPETIAAHADENCLIPSINSPTRFNGDKQPFVSMETTQNNRKERISRRQASVSGCEADYREQLISNTLEITGVLPAESGDQSYREQLIGNTLHITQVQRLVKMHIVFRVKIKLRQKDVLWKFV